jgi:hypothetical protein
MAWQICIDAVVCGASLQQLPAAHFNQWRAGRAARRDARIERIACAIASESCLR